MTARVYLTAEAAARFPDLANRAGTVQPNADDPPGVVTIRLNDSHGRPGYARIWLKAEDVEPVHTTEPEPTP